MMTVHTTVDSPVGALYLTGDGVALTSVTFDESRAEGPYDPAAFAAAREQLTAYFAGGRTTFDLDVLPSGTEFQRRVWAAVDAIPYGTTTTYGALAARIGAPRDRIRAVGAAIGANPLLVVRPCHRVIGADGALTGYAGGLERKRSLLTLEGALQPLFA
ncbi:methylated-DNA--[protein]-cysteine S-methyltransferase [Nonomuraea sp. NPDC050556]|uniref:methylated-DNA--[protein]-cysteine S-methyltransferase n=1 Tax=Nonomuraea sp. NPDC050556 TaxID=3364369 RepID=UPI003791B6B6